MIELNLSGVSMQENFNNLENHEVFYPLSVDEALNILEKYACTKYAGGTDLMVQFRKGKSQPVDLKFPVIYLSNIEQLHKISGNKEYLQIGSCCTYSEILQSSLVPEVLKDAILTIGSPSIRNSGTLGGNICNASPAADGVCVLSSLDAKLVVASKQNERIISIRDFIKGRRLIDCAENEIVQTILIPKNKIFFSKFEKIGLRGSMTLSKLSVCLVVVEKNEKKHFQLTFQAVSPTIIRVAENEEIISSKFIDFSLFSNIYRKHFSAIDDQRSEREYRENTAILLGYKLYKQAYESVFATKKEL
ncbi:MAG TPA: FAD binding domain-containing protein [Exilispira sp.]|nr:FAD binding domain-containing protein [Exilispira sp.]